MLCHFLKRHSSFLTSFLNTGNFLNHVSYLLYLSNLKIFSGLHLRAIISMLHLLQLLILHVTFMLGLFSQKKMC